MGQQHSFLNSAAISIFAHPLFLPPLALYLKAASQADSWVEHICMSQIICITVLQNEIQNDRFLNIAVSCFLAYECDKSGHWCIRLFSSGCVLVWDLCVFASRQVHDAPLLHTIKPASCTESSLKGFTTEEKFLGHEFEADGRLQKADNQEMNMKETHVNLLGVLNNSETVPKIIHSISVEIIDGWYDKDQF